jgi:hypothetical protein
MTCPTKKRKFGGAFVCSDFRSPPSLWTMRGFFVFMSHKFSDRYGEAIKSNGAGLITSAEYCGERLKKAYFNYGLITVRI